MDSFKIYSNNNNFWRDLDKEIKRTFLIPYLRDPSNITKQNIYMLLIIN